ncbi:Rha family transcriptional regulator [Ectopseudomonas toyotomiensis]|nr:Rha family transcriptional regulator [Pseudomonas toyotomiensis]
MGSLILPSTCATMTSLEIAELVNSNHADVRRSIERLAERGVVTLPPLAEVSNAGPGPKTIKAYSFSGEQGKRDSIIVVAQLSPEFTARLVDRWQELESQLAKPRELSRLELIQMALAAEQEKIRIEAERDHAIATKAQIGSKREASAMATASAAVREVNRLKGELGKNSKHATVIAVERATGKRFPKNAYVALRRWCKRNNAQAVDVVDERYGTVKAWPAGAWLEAFDICLESLFSA